MAPLDVVFVYNKANPYGISRDVDILEKALIETNKNMKRMFGKPRHLDMREPPSICDIQFHFEIPIYANCPWATINILLINPEQFIYDSFMTYMHMFQYIICRDMTTFTKCKEIGIPEEKLMYLSWAIKPNTENKEKYPTNYEAGLVSFLGGSDMKFKAVKELLPSWPSNQQLTIYTTRPDFEKQLFVHIPALESTDESAKEIARKHVRDNLLLIVPIFSKQQHLLSDEFSMLDVAIAPLLWRLGHYGIELPNQAAPLLKYAEKLFSRPLYADAMTPSEKAMRK
jgi:hypothetical protein